MTAQQTSNTNKLYRNFLALSLFNAFLMMVGGVDIIQATYAYSGLIGYLPTNMYVTYGIVYLILGVIYLIIDYFALKKKYFGIKGALAFGVIGLITAILWLPAGILSLIASVGAIYYGYKFSKQNIQK